MLGGMSYERKCGRLEFVFFISDACLCTSSECFNDLDTGHTYRYIEILFHSHKTVNMLSF